jgi:hypothetical protein
VDTSTRKANLGLMLVLVLTTTTIGGLSLLSSTTTTMTTAFAQACEDPMQPCHGTPPVTPGAGPDPSCWGEATSGFAKDSGGVGEHSSDPIDNEDPHDTPRSGIGNMPEDTPGEHGQAVATLFGQSCDER